MCALPDDKVDDAVHERALRAELARSKRKRPLSRWSESGRGNVELV